MQYRISALGQVASGSIDVAEDYVRLEVFLPWLLAKVAETLQALIRKEGTLLLIVLVSTLPNTNPLKRVLTALCYRLVVWVRVAVEVGIDAEYA